MRDPKARVTRRRPGATLMARALRQKETEAEYRLWGHLRNRLLNGYKFSRQIPLGPYVVDFLCREARLIVELDGWQHADSEHDERRTRWLNKNGYSVLRFWNHDVQTACDATLATILAALNGDLDKECRIQRFYPRADNGAEMQHDAG